MTCDVERGGVALTSSTPSKAQARKVERSNAFADAFVNLYAHQKRALSANQ